MNSLAQDIDQELLDKQKGLLNHEKDLELSEKFDDLKSEIEPVLLVLKARVAKMEIQLFNQKELNKRIEDSYTDDKGLKEIREQGELNGDGRTCFAYCRRIL